MSFKNDGILIKKSFISSKLAKDINQELSLIFKKQSTNGTNGYIDIARNYRKVSFPIFSIKSVNLAELSLTVLDQITGPFEMAREDFFLTNLEIFQEINSEPLFWHTDNRNGMVRAFLYIQGGDENSGAFKYMIGTHRRNYYVKHKLIKSQIEQLKDTIFVAKGSPGDLVIADTVGFHANCPRTKLRRIIVFEFQPRAKIANQSSIFLSSTNLSEEVINNINVFRNRSSESEFLHGTDFDFFGHKATKTNEKIYRIAQILVRNSNRADRFLNCVLSKLKFFKTSKVSIIK